MNIKEENSKTTAKITVEIWSDFTCPFCYIGHRNYQNALSGFSHQDEVKTILRSFELTPNGSPKKGETVLENLSFRKGWSIEYTKQMMAQVTMAAQSVGITFDYDDALAANTFDAHRLLCYATRNGKEQAVLSAIFKAHFTDKMDIGDLDALAHLAIQAGLNKEEVTKMFEGNDYADLVRADEQRAVSLGVSGVPFFLINEKYSIQGAQPESAFANALDKIYN